MLIIWSCVVYVNEMMHLHFNTGSHGAGNPHETFTPVVAWGAGIRGPLKSSNQDTYSDSYSEGMSSIYLHFSFYNCFIYQF